MAETKRPMTTQVLEQKAREEKRRETERGYVTELARAMELGSDFEASDSDVRAVREVLEKSADLRRRVADAQAAGTQQAVRRFSTLRPPRVA